MNGAYAREGSDDIRFQDYFGSLQLVVASSAQQDSGLFEANLRDERYLPFENAGVIDSEWQLELPANPSQDDPTQFDYGTIADVILHIRYTARDGGCSHGPPPSSRSRTSSTPLRPPARCDLNSVVRVDLFAQSTDDPAPATISVADRADKTDAGTQKDTLTKMPPLNDLLVGKLANVPLPAQPTGELKLYFEDAKLSDLWIPVTWSG